MQCGEKHCKIQKPIQINTDPINVTASMNGQKVQALLDSESLDDFVFTTIVKQLNLKRN